MRVHAYASHESDKSRVKHVRAWVPSRKGCLHADNRRIRYEIIVKISNHITYSCNLCHVDIDTRMTRITVLFLCRLNYVDVYLRSTYKPHRFLHVFIIRRLDVLLTFPLAANHCYTHVRVYRITNLFLLNIKYFRLF